MRGRLAGAGTAVLVLAIAACSAAHGSGRRSVSPGVPSTVPPSLSASQAAAISRTMHCDRHPRPPAPPSPFRTGHAPGVQPVPAVAMICEYEYWPYQHRPARLTGQVTLGATAADGLAAVVDSATTVHPEPIGCGGDLPRHAHAVVVLFGYPGSRVISATAHQPTCNDQGNVLTGGRSFRLPWPVLDALLAPATNSAGNNGPRAPDVTGLSLAAARAAARRHGLAIQLSGVITDPRAPLGSILYQGVPPGAASRLRDGPAVRVIVAVRPTPACTPGQLRLTYRGNGYQRGTDWGAIVIRNTGQAPCRLPGTARITGVGRSGQPVTPVYAASARGISPYSDPTTAPLILSPRMGPVADGLAASHDLPLLTGGLAAAIRLQGSYGPTPASARSCRVIRAWRVVIGGLSRTLPNADPAGPDPLVPSGAFVTCAGRLSPALTYYGLLTY